MSSKRPKWFAVTVTPAEPTYGPKVNRYGPSTKGRRLVGLAFYWGRRGVSVGKYLPPRSNP